MTTYAKQRLSELLCGLSVDGPVYTVKIQELKECSGDCSISKRKKDKILALFDLTLKLKWEACEKDGARDGETLKAVKGDIKVSEFATGHTDMDDLEFTCTVSGKGPREEAGKLEAMKLFGVIFEQLMMFEKDLQAQGALPPSS